MDLLQIKLIAKINLFFADLKKADIKHTCSPISGLPGLSNNFSIITSILKFTLFPFVGLQ